MMSDDSFSTCYISKLEKHLSICNARQQEQPSYIVHDVNAPAVTEDCPRLPLAKLPLRRILQVIDKVNMLYDSKQDGRLLIVFQLQIECYVLKIAIKVGKGGWNWNEKAVLPWNFFTQNAYLQLQLVLFIIIILLLTFKMFR